MADRKEAYLQRLYAALGETSRDFDRTVLSLASGALVLSITFLRDIAPDLESRWIIIAAWTFLGLSMCLTLVSYVTSERALLRAFKDHFDGKEEDARGGRWGWLTDLMNWGAGSCFIAGVLFLIVFAITNLPE